MANAKQEQTEIIRFKAPSANGCGNAGAMLSCRVNIGSASAIYTSFIYNYNGSFEDQSHAFHERITLLSKRLASVLESL